MKQAQIIGLSIALAAGGLAFVVSSNFTSKPPAQIVRTEIVDSVKVLVAKTDIALGQVATESNFRWQDWPKSALSPSFITQTNQPTAAREFSGTIARMPLTANEPITPVKLIKAGSGGVLAAILPAGMRAISIKISEHTSVGRLILPNDHVDVLLTTRSRARGSATDEISTEVLLRNIRVLAMGQQIEVKEGRKASEGNVAALALSPAQAEVIAQSTIRGELQLVLRSIADIGAAQVAVEEKKDRGTSIKVLRYGVKSKVYGTN